MSNKAVAHKIVEAWKIIGSIPKNGRNPKFNYAFVREEDAADAIRNAFIKVGLSIVPSVEKVERSTIKTSQGSEMQHVIITMKFTLTDQDTGETDSFVMVGEAADAFDKAVYKAITGCTKYAYTKLALSGGEDNEEEDVGDRAPKEKSRPVEKPVEKSADAQYRKPEPKSEPEPKPKPAPAPTHDGSAKQPGETQTLQLDTTGKITAVIPAMKGKPASVTLKPNDSQNPLVVQFDPKSVDVPAMLKLQAAKADVRIICDVTSGNPFLMYVGAANAA